MHEVFEKNRLDQLSNASHVNVVCFLPPLVRLAKVWQILANFFTDYDPGIHWPQVQMQSGTTGINAIRIYNPIKQGIDQDPEGFLSENGFQSFVTLQMRIT